ncbi:MAG: sugar transferase [Candidatus Omnitrophica bacterium]|nr:sugar transferase [Candidatus Omnitrophota bacterium]
MRWLYRHGGKRLFDLGLSTAGLFAFILPAISMGMALRASSGRPIFFRQIRIGRKGEAFALWKFRTMDQNGQVSRLGCFLRARAMDELPQLWNILKGQMSFVGPRPLVPEELREVHLLPEARGRFEARPGLTGLAQIYSSKTPLLSERIRWDLLYTERCSLGLDLVILLRSIGITFQAAWERPGPKALLVERSNR